MGRAADAGVHYGMPLYGAAWPPGEALLVCGGGGQMASGIKNRCVWASAAGGRLSEQLGEVSFGLDCPERMALSPDGGTLLVAMAGGGLRRYALSRDAAGGLQLAEAPIEPAKRVAEAEQDVKALAFSGDGALLALGCASGQLVVLRWPSLRPHLSDASSRSPVRDVDFSPAHGHRLLAVAREDGGASLWDAEAGTPLGALRPPKALSDAPVARLRFGRDGGGALLTLHNDRRMGAFVAEWTDARGDGAFAFSRKAHASGQPGTALAVHPAGSHVGVGTAEGDVHVLEASTLAPLQHARRAHMVFVTALAFSPAGDALASAGADGRAHVLRLRPARGRGRGPVRAAARLLLMLAALAALLIVAIELALLAARTGGAPSLSGAAAHLGRLQTPAAWEASARRAGHALAYALSAGPAAAAAAARAGTL
jgi:prolactin regulatory element-binding protein